jgi:competence protein ComEA
MASTMSDAFKEFLAKREAEQQAGAKSQRWLLILGAVAVIVVLAIVMLRGDPSKRILNPNTATAVELATLPDVGPQIAKAIIAKRQGKPFTKAEDLLDVKGIGPKTLDKMRPRLKFDP